MSLLPHLFRLIAIGIALTGYLGIGRLIVIIGLIRYPRLADLSIMLVWFGWPVFAILTLFALALRRPLTAMRVEANRDRMQQIDDAERAARVVKSVP